MGYYFKQESVDVEDMDFCLFSSDNDVYNDDNGDLDGTERSRDGGNHDLHAVHML